ncbi:hypothetical protein FNV43_RR04300 [Rhamnella rubrinervis]|uniref:Uncharacterized protein n=1 Tax=Rhamnella rubrinervis TaxID=2594499 RepID=A0A8K0MPX8_9ROSA|nr:hypothetical protein FNV43_RR04300 [Rhamnella rubrinervis]
MDHNDMIVDDIVLYSMATEIMNENKDNEPKSVEECRCRSDWFNWKDAIQAKFDSLSKCEVFGPVVRITDAVKLVRWIYPHRWAIDCMVVPTDEYSQYGNF